MFFRELQLEDKKILEKFLILTPKYNCDFCFSDLYLWKKYYKTEIFVEDDILYLRNYINNTHQYFIPLGNTKKGIECLITYTRLQKEQLRIIGIEQQDLSFIDNRFILAHNRSNDDYIYSSLSLSNLQGKNYKSKRNFVNSFKANYSYTVKQIKDFNLQEDMSFLDLWGRENPEEDRHSFSGEKEAIYQALKNLSSLDLDGLILKVDNTIVGLTIGTHTRNTFITHFEKVNYNYRGASQMINYLLANYVKNTADIINREEDLGIPGLRKAKLSYYPEYLIKSYTAYYKEDYHNLFINTDGIIEIDNGGTL